MPEFRPPVWRDAAGAPLGCREKLRVPDDNLEEVRARARDVLEDAVLLGSDERRVTRAMHGLIDALDSQYAGESA